jgi:pimeloyl-ACP methyl ester carboxylesterase/tellurite resistance protein
MEPTFSLVEFPSCFARTQATSGLQFQHVMTASARHMERIGRTHGARAQEFWRSFGVVMAAFAAAQGKNGLSKDAETYARDAARRAILTVDVLRERADNDARHEANGSPAVLSYDSELVMDGKTLPRPVNYQLLRIVPPQGVQTFDWKRPYLIVDPRAGHGAGIGGFKSDSQVGVALHDGHPVYFLVFRPQPEPCQTLADVMRAEAEFVREIGRRHPKSPKPIIVGNCQGGWATMVLAAANPDITGPLVINGAPLAYWSGRLGENPMRYNGGLLGGLSSALLLSDLGNGVFDGANLVANFEMLNPSRNYFGKYYDLYSDVENGRERFLEFERWWGGFHYMTEAEIRWIVEQLFVGNKLSRGEAHLERGRRLDLKAIRSPIIVFASWGDNITPPQQALNWIVDTYADEQEIKICGQRIVYMIHDKVGHLGIFVSSSVAKKEHAEVTSTMKTIEALAPGLYEMQIEAETGEGLGKRFRVSFAERRIADILKVDESDRAEEVDFAAVARVSQLNADAYDLVARPVVQSMTTPQSARWLRETHPARLQRRFFSSENPMSGWLDSAVTQVRAEKAEAVDHDNPFLLAERLWAAGVEQTLDLWRDVRDAAYESTFFMLYGGAFMHWVGRYDNFTRTHKDRGELRLMPQAQAALMNVGRGHFAEAVIRMLLLLSEARGSVRRDRLERSAHMLSADEPFASLGAERRAQLIHEQSIIVEFEREGAIETLPLLLPARDDRRRAVGAVEFVAGAIEDMEPRTVHMLQRIRLALGLPAIETNMTLANPLEPIEPGGELVYQDQ